MAKIKTSALVADIRGKVGGNVFSRNLGGAFVRVFTAPLNPQSNAQTVIRERVAHLSTLWRTLADGVRDSWNAAAANFPFEDVFGDTRFLSGQQLFMKFQSNLLAIDEDPVTAAPLPGALPSFDLDVPLHTVTDLDVEATGYQGPTANVSMIIRATRPLSPGRSNAYRADFKQIAVAPAATVVGSLDVSASYEAVFGPLAGQAGQKIFFEAVPILVNTGQAASGVRSRGVILTSPA